ncbi:D-Ala-D-Ala carboxypeptidase family metallohydrolase, partial [Acinetobacter baumannii]
ASYRAWLNTGDHYERVREYEKFLARHDVAGIVPSFELLRSARDWQKCGRSEYAVPNRELWNNSLSTLRVFKYLIAAKVLTDFEVTSVYRDLPLNECAGGASSSKHLFNSAIDFRIGPEVPQPQDYAFIENTKFKLCQFWAQHGQSLNLGIGLYSSGQIHIDTQGYRTWGPDLTRNTSMCNF